VRYFAALREVLGPQEVVVLEQGATLGALRDRLIAASPRHAEALRRGRALRCAVDQVLADESAVLEDGAEVAFFPPVTGG
jgi:molybdopterin synthase sulfur carrier subunit